MSAITVAALRMDGIHTSPAAADRSTASSSSAHLSSLPAAVSRNIAEQFLTDVETRRWAWRTWTQLRALREYRIKAYVPLVSAVRLSECADQPQALQPIPPHRCRIGVIINVSVPRMASPAEWIELVSSLPRSVKSIKFGLDFNSQVEQLTLPPALTSIDFGWKFD
jgi:hypothetical protein